VFFVFLPTKGKQKTLNQLCNNDDNPPLSKFEKTALQSCK